MEPNLSILDLPDDCLIHTYNNLGLTDLLSINKSCKHFYTAVESSFLVNHKIISIACWNYSQTYSIRSAYDRSSAITDFSDMVRIFENFGCWITSMTISGTNDYSTTDITQILYLLNKYSKHSLKWLSLENVVFDVNKISDFSELFPQLERLCIRNVFNSSAVEKCIEFCKNLKDLRIIMEKSTEQRILLHPSSKLERMIYNCIGNEMTSAETVQLLQKCPHLRLIQISSSFIPTNHHLNYLKNVETLSIDLRCLNASDIEQPDWNGLFQLKNLTHLELNLSENISEPLSKVSSNPSTNLEVLVLNVWCFNDIISFLKTFNYKSLRTVMFKCDRITNEPDFQENVVKRFAKSLIHLKKMHFIQFPMSSFNFVLQLVESAPELRSLTLSTKVFEHFSFVNLLRLIDIQRSKNAQITVNLDYKTFVEVQTLVQQDCSNYLFQYERIIKIKCADDFGEGCGSWLMAKSEILSNL